jgi:hypothetical protein
LPPPGPFVQFLLDHATNNSMSDWGATQRVPAEVVLAGGAVLGGDLHLATRLTYPADIESPLEMLNRTDPFFALTLHEGGVAFVSKAQVVVVSCRDQNSSSDPARASAAKLVALDVELTNGTQFRGRSSFELPPSRARALDYVNVAGGFFTLWTDDLTRYINKSLVRIIRPLD